MKSRALYALLLIIPLLLSACSGAGSLQTAAGTATRADTFEMSEAYVAYYGALQARATQIEIVKLELDAEGKVKSIAVNQAPEAFEIPAPQKSYSPGWTTANKFVDGLWGAVRFAVPGAAAWATADAISKIAARPNVTNSYNSAGNDYAGGDYSAPIDSSVTGSYSPIDNSLTDSQNPIDNGIADSYSPIDNTDNSSVDTDNSNQGNLVPVAVVE
jgi:hypothetical protein